MLLKSTRPETGSVIITFDGHVVGTRNGLTRAQIDRFLAGVEDAGRQSHLTLVD